MNMQDAMFAIAISIAAGALVGVEREQSQHDRKGTDFGGVRTFPLVALLGCLGGLLHPFVGAWLLGALFVGVLVLLAVSFARAENKDLGISSEMAAIVTFALGVVAATPEMMPLGPRFLLVAAGAAATMALLALKRPLHGFVAQLSRDDMYATAKFVLLALVVIPVLPNRSFGPWNAVNPFKVGLMIALVAGMSFVGYVASRLIGSKRGLLITGLLGGIASSTAVTLTFSARAKETPAITALAAVAILAACSTMFVRVLIVVGLVDRDLLRTLVFPMSAAALAGFASAALLLYRASKNDKHGEPVPLHNPFELKRAVQFGLLYGVVLFVAKAAQATVGTSGVYASAILAGLTDVDAVTLTLTELHRSGTSSHVVVVGITLAAATNTLVKAGIALIAGGWQLGWRVGGSLLVALSCGAVAVLVERALGI